MLEPRDIEAKQFTTTRLAAGYDQGEVDAFLDRVLSDYRYMHERLSAAEAENRKLRAETVSSTAETVVLPQSPSPALERLIALAEEEARKIKAQAAWEASKTQADAAVEADRLREEAREAGAQEHASIVADAQERKAALIGEISQLDDQINNLKASRDQHVTALKTALQQLETE